MDANAKASAQPVRVVGHLARLGEVVQVLGWTPPTETEADAMPPLPGRSPRGWELEEVRPSAQPHAGVAGARAVAEAAPASVERGVPDAPVKREARPAWVEDGSAQALVLERPEAAAQLVRQLLVEEGQSGGDPLLAGLQGVAALLLALGPEPTGEVMKHLSDYEIEECTQALVGLKLLPGERQRHVLQAFRQRLVSGEGTVAGGAEFARGALERAVGPQKAGEILRRAASTASSGLYMLKNVAPDQIAPFISHEHPQTIALILSQLGASQAAGILAQLPGSCQGDVAHRIATMENIPPAVLKQLEDGLEQSLRDLLAGTRDVGGPKVVADILNLTGSSVEKNVLDQMDAADPEASESVRNLMFTFADIAKLTDREIQALLGEVDQQDLVIALKAAEEELKTKLLSNVSEETRTSITQEMEFLGPMRLTEVEDVQLRIVQQVRQLEERGQITIVRGEAVDYWV
jgi:flagellar motor switch protein FliG